MVGKRSWSLPALKADSVEVVGTPPDFLPTGGSACAPISFSSIFQTDRSGLGGSPASEPRRSAPCSATIGASRSAHRTIIPSVAPLLHLEHVEGLCPLVQISDKHYRAIWRTLGGVSYAMPPVDGFALPILSSNKSPGIRHWSYSGPVKASFRIFSGLRNES